MNNSYIRAKAYDFIFDFGEKYQFNKVLVTIAFLSAFLPALVHNLLTLFVYYPLANLGWICCCGDRYYRPRIFLNDFLLIVSERRRFGGLISPAGSRPLGLLPSLIYFLLYLPLFGTPVVVFISLKIASSIVIAALALSAVVINTLLTWMYLLIRGVRSILTCPVRLQASSSQTNASLLEMNTDLVQKNTALKAQVSELERKLRELKHKTGDKAEELKDDWFEETPFKCSLCLGEVVVENQPSYLVVDTILRKTGADPNGKQRQLYEIVQFYDLDCINSARTYRLKSPATRRPIGERGIVKLNTRRFTMFKSAYIHALKTGVSPAPALVTKEPRTRSMICGL